MLEFKDDTEGFKNKQNYFQTNKILTKNPLYAYPIKSLNSNDIYFDQYPQMQCLGNDLTLDVVMSRTLLRFNPLTNENTVLYKDLNFFDLSALQVSKTNENLMSFGSCMGNVHLFDLNRKTVINTYRNEIGAVCSIDFKENLLLVGGDFGKVSLFDIRLENPLVYKNQMDKSMITQSLLSPFENDQFLVVSEFDGVYFHDLRTGKSLSNSKLNSAFIKCFWNNTKRNQFIVIKNDFKDKHSFIQNWNFFTMEKINQKKTEGAIQSADLVKKEHIIYSYQKGTIQQEIINVNNFESSPLYNEHPDHVYKIVANKSGSNFISNCYHNNIKYWEVRKSLKSKEKELAYQEGSNQFGPKEFR